MIKEENVEINLNSKTIKHYWELGYSGTTNEIIQVKVKDLTKGSHVKITAICEICGVKNIIPYKSYLKYFKNGNYYSCHKCCLDKKVQTSLKNYGVEHPLQSKEIRDKVEKTCMVKYGVKTYVLTEEFLNDDEINKKRKETRIKNGTCIPDNKLTEWELYKKKVRYETTKQKKILMENWDGYDYYDGEYIKDNHDKYESRQPEYPSIDHKISVKYGFDNDIEPKEICEINNLCITKTRINNYKKNKNEKDFIL